MKRSPKYWPYIIFYVIIGLKNCMHAHAPACTMDAKALEHTHKNKHAKFDYLACVDIYELDPAQFFSTRISVAVMLEEDIS